jgi:hypothetical protein
MIAYVDESMRGSAGGLYLVAAAVIVDAELDFARRQALGVLLPRQHRFHWRNESEPQRDLMLKAIASLEYRALVYACHPAPRRQERARALCLEKMLWDFRDEGVDMVVFESREAHNDKKDAKNIAHAQRAGRAPDDFRYSFMRPQGEPLLWIADAIAGASSAHVAGEELHYLAGLPVGTIRITEFAP